jgi:HlyD family secretion protein
MAKTLLPMSKDDWSDTTKEILDSLPKVWTRGMLYFLVLFASIVIPWSMLFKVDETGTAKGRIEPQGKTIKLDAAVAGRVTEILVKEGDTVKRGQNLLVIQSELVSTELQQTQDKQNGQLKQLSQLNLLKNQLLLALTTQQQQNQAQELEKLAQIDQTEQNIQTLKSSSTLQKAEKLAEVNQAKQTLIASQNNSKIAATSLKSARREVERFQQLFDEKVVAEVNLVEKRDIAQEREKIYQKAQSDIQQAQLNLVQQQNIYQRATRQTDADIKQAQLKLKEQQNNYKSLTYGGKLTLLRTQQQLKNIEKEIAGTQAEISQNQRQIQSLKFQLGQRILKAPVDGTVFLLFTPQPGSVVQPGKTLVEIAADTSRLIVRAQIATSESGSLRKGLPVQLKFDAYPFQEYGTMLGELFNISPTSSDIDTPQGKIAAYNLEILLKRDCIPTNSKCVPLRAGDTAKVEIVLRQRRIIDFLLDPFKRLQDGGFEL